MDGDARITTKDVQHTMTTITTQPIYHHGVVLAQGERGGEFHPLSSLEKVLEITINDADGGVYV